ncbi:hypothetical protein ScPMuIL_004169 [Solemya velum]
MYPIKEDGLKGNNSWLQYTWQGINLFMTVFLLAAAYVNVNDDDWYLWVPIYLVAALLCMPVVVKPAIMETSLWNMLTGIFMGLCVAYLIYQVVIFIEVIVNKPENPLRHEEGRELGGLLIILTWLGICRFTNLGRPNRVVSNRSMMNALLLVSVTLAILPLVIWSLCFVGDLHKQLGHCKDMFL